MTTDPITSSSSAASYIPIDEIQVSIETLTDSRVILIFVLVEIHIILGGDLPLDAGGTRPTLLPIEEQGIQSLHLFPSECVPIVFRGLGSEELLVEFQPRCQLETKHPDKLLQRGIGGKEDGLQRTDGRRHDEK
jgi:hypothetical protein